MIRPAVRRFKFVTFDVRTEEAPRDRLDFDFFQRQRPAIVRHVAQHVRFDRRHRVWWTFLTEKFQIIPDLLTTNKQNALAEEKHFLKRIIINFEKKNSSAYKKHRVLKLHKTYKEKFFFYKTFCFYNIVTFSRRRYVFYETHRTDHSIFYPMRKI